MKRQFYDFKLLKLVIFSCLLMNINLTNTIGQSHIYISTDGDDSNDGSTPALAIKSLDTLKNLVTNYDSIFFKKGDIWKGEDWYNSKSNLYIGVYGDESEMPIITAIDTIVLAMDSLNWTFSNGRWEANIGVCISRLFLDGVEQLRSQNLFLLGVPDSQGQKGTWYCHGSVLYMESDNNPANDYDLFEGSMQAYVFLFELTTNCRMDSLKLEGGNFYSLWLAGSDSTTIKHCEVGKDARGGILINKGSDYNLIDSIIVDSHFAQNYGYIQNVPENTDRGVGDGVNFNNNANYNTISNVTFKNWSHNALEISHDKNTETTDSVNHNKFLNIDIDASDIPYAHPFGADGPLNRCSYNEWAYITVNNCRTAIQVNGNHNHVHNSILQNFKQSPAKSTVSAPAIWCAVYEADTVDSLFVYNVSEDNLFENLLIYNTDESAIRITDFGYEDRVVNNITFRNNLIINPGLNPINNDYDLGTAIYFDDVGTIDSIFFEGNLLFQDSLMNPITLHLSNSDQYLDFDSFNILDNEFGIMSNQNLNVDPELTGIIPSDSSVAINSGINAITQPEYDFSGNLRLIYGRIDIGPFENQTLCQDGAVIFVDVDATGLENGTSWENAYTTVYDVIEDCPEIKDNEIWVAEGVYFPTASLNRDSSISFPSSTTLYGGWKGNEFTLSERNLGQYPTILSGDIGVAGDSTDNSHSVIVQESDSLVVIDGVTIQDGFGASQGAGINIQNSQIDLLNITIRNNMADEARHMYVGNSNVKLENVIVDDMTSSENDVIFTNMSVIFIINFLIQITP